MDALFVPFPFQIFQAPLCLVFAKLVGGIKASVRGPACVIHKQRYVNLDIYTSF